MDRRARHLDLLLLGAALLIGLGWPSEGWTQQKVRLIGGFLLGAEGGEAQVQSHVWEAFKGGLRSDGWTPGHNVDVVYANVRGTGYPEAAAELVRRKVDVIWADSAPAVRAAFAATRSIPIIAQDFTTDPVSAGYARSYGRPGGNITGVFLDAPEFSAKWIELLKATVPGLTRVAVLWDPSPGDVHVRALQAVAPSLGIQLQIVEVRKPRDIDTAGAAFRGRPQALIVLPSPMALAESPRLVRLAAAQRLAAISPFRLFAEGGGTLAYGPEAVAVVERGAVQVTRILRGAKPGDVPIERPVRYELTVNLKAAKAIDLTIPDSVLGAADLVIR
jgi:putative ABC transport system substrate-binding protein